MGTIDSQIVVSVPQGKPLSFYYGWVNLFVAALAMTATLPGRTHGLGLVTKPLLDQLHISDVLFGTMNFWAIVLGGFFCVPVGRLLDRFGVRVVLTTTVLALGAAVVLMAYASGPIDLFVTLLFTRGLGQAALSLVSMAVVGKWFKRRLELAMGVFSVLLAVGFIAATIGVGVAVQLAGWRAAWAGVGWTLLLGLAPLSALLVRSTPDLTSANHLAEFPMEAEGPADADFTLVQALRTPAFWVFSIGASLFNLVWSAITLFNEKILAAQGFNAMTYYIIMAVLTASGLAANVLAGWLSTRISTGRLLGGGLVVLAAALALFPFVRSMMPLVLYTVAMGGAGGVVTVVFFAFYGRCYGRKHLGLIQGAAQILSVFASALGPYLIAECRDRTGAYDMAFYAAAVASIVVGTAAMFTLSPGQRLAETVL